MDESLQVYLLNVFAVVMMLVCMRLMLRPGRLFYAGCAAVLALSVLFLRFDPLEPYTATFFLVPQFLFALVCFDEPPSHALAASALYTLLSGVCLVLAAVTLRFVFDADILSDGGSALARPAVLVLTLIFVLAAGCAAILLLRRLRVWERIPPAATAAVILVNILVTAMSDAERGDGASSRLYLFAGAAGGLTLLCLACLFLVHEARDMALRADLLSQRRRFELTYRRELEAERGRLAEFCRDSLCELEALRRAVREGRGDDAGQALEALETRVDAPHASILSGNPAVDALLRAKRADALLQGCRLEAALDLRGSGRLSDPDAVSIYANLIDNALAACRAGEAVHVNGIVRHGVAVLEVRNPAHEGEALPSAFRLPLQPGRRRGIGLASVQRTAGRYGGALTLRTEDGSVVARVVLPVAPE